MRVNILKIPLHEPEEDMWLWSVSPENAPDEAEYITLTYKKGDPVAINGEEMSPATLLNNSLMTMVINMVSDV